MRILPPREPLITQPSLFSHGPAPFKASGSEGHHCIDTDLISQDKSLVSNRTLPLLAMLRHASVEVGVSFSVAEGGKTGIIERESPT